MKHARDITAEEVSTTLEKVTTEVAEVRYFQRDLVTRIEEMACNAANFHMVAMILEGRTPLEAGQMAAESLLPLTFHLGLLVGRELEASEAFAHMMGGFDGPATDAGDTEHGGQ